MIEGLEPSATPCSLAFGSDPGVSRGAVHWTRRPADLHCLPAARPRVLACSVLPRAWPAGFCDMIIGCILHIIQ